MRLNLPNYVPKFVLTFAESRCDSPSDYAYCEKVLRLIPEELWKTAENALNFPRDDKYYAYYEELFWILMDQGKGLPAATLYQKRAAQKEIIKQIKNLRALLRKEPFTSNLLWIKLIDLCTKSKSLNEEKRKSADELMNAMKTPIYEHEPSTFGMLAAFSELTLVDTLTALADHFAQPVYDIFEAKHIQDQPKGHETAQHSYFAQQLYAWFIKVDNKPHSNLVKNTVQKLLGPSNKDFSKRALERLRTSKAKMDVANKK